MLKQKSVYTFDAMIASLQQVMERFPDGRTGKNIQYGIMDAAAGAFSVFFTQCPSLPPSFITPQDGDTKQDCELKACKRWLDENASLYVPLGVTFLGDDLYSHEPFCRELLGKRSNFILVCKRDSHKTAYEWIKGITSGKTEDRFDGKTHQIYTYTNHKLVSSEI